MAIVARRRAATFHEILKRDLIEIGYKEAGFAGQGVAVLREVE